MVPTDPHTHTSTHPHTHTHVPHAVPRLLATHSHQTATTGRNPRVDSAKSTLHAPLRQRHQHLIVGHTTGLVVDNTTLAHERQRISHATSPPRGRHKKRTQKTRHRRTPRLPFQSVIKPHPPSTHSTQANSTTLQDPQTPLHQPLTGSRHIALTMAARSRDPLRTGDN